MGSQRIAAAQRQAARRAWPYSAALVGAGRYMETAMAKNDIEARIISVHRPYHHQIEQILQAMQRRFGAAILLDLHSMPPVAGHISPEPRNL